MRKFTADTHYGHGNIIRYCARPFADAGQMSADLVLKALGTLGEGDSLWHLGDVALGNLGESMTCLAAISAQHHVTLMAGNHDRCHPCNRNPDRWRTEYYEKGGIGMLHTVPVKLALGDGTEVNVCHFPYAERGDGMEDRHGRLVPDRFAQWRPADDGSWLLCGHVHNAWRQRGRMINVGVDAWGGRPVGEDEILRLIGDGPADLMPVPWERPR